MLAHRMSGCPPTPNFYHLHTGKELFLCYLILDAVLCVCVPFLDSVLGMVWTWIVSVPDHCRLGNLVCKAITKRRS